MDMSQFSVVDAAFQAANIINEAQLDPLSIPCLGSEPWDRYINHIMKLSGVDVKLVRRPDGDEEPLYQAVQIVTDEEISDALKVTELDNILMVSGDAYLGVQVKLSGACEWHITVSDEIPSLSKRCYHPHRKNF
jgi:hypothetical protein